MFNDMLHAGTLIIILLVRMTRTSSLRGMLKPLRPMIMQVHQKNQRNMLIQTLSRNPEWNAGSSNGNHHDGSYDRNKRKRHFPGWSRFALSRNGSMNVMRTCVQYEASHPWCDDADRTRVRVVLMRWRNPVIMGTGERLHE